MDAKDINRIIGDNLRKVRIDMNYSLDRVAELTGISKSMLGQIERGESTPTVTTLWKISNGLKVSFSSLMENRTGDTEIITQDKAPRLDDTDEGCKVYSFIPYSPEMGFESYVMELEPKCTHESEAHVNASYEFIYVVKGEISIKTAGSIHSVAEGQMLKFEANSSHSYMNVTNETVKCHIIIAVK